MSRHKYHRISFTLTFRHLEEMTEYLRTELVIAGSRGVSTAKSLRSGLAATHKAFVSAADSPSCDPRSIDHQEETES